MKIQALLVSAIIALPMAAVAQDYSGSITLGYGLGELKDFNQDVNSFTFDGAIKIRLSDAWSLGLKSSYVGIDIKDVPVDIAGNLLGANVSYAFGNGAWAGVYTENTDLSIDLLPINFGVTDYGIEGGYAASGFDVVGFLGKSRDITSFGLSAKYSPMDGAEIGGLYMRSTVDSDMIGIDIDADVIGLAGSYTFNEAWGLFAGIGRTSIDDFNGDLTSFGLGASYTFANTAVPMAVSLEFARSSLDFGSGSTDFDTVRLGLTVPLGGKASVLPKNSVADAILNPSRNVITQTVLTAF